jgi:hypothetical protein
MLVLACTNEARVPMPCFYTLLSSSYAQKSKLVRNVFFEEEIIDDLYLSPSIGRLYIDIDVCTSLRPVTIF